MISSTVCMTRGWFAGYSVRIVAAAAISVAKCSPFMLSHFRAEVANAWISRALADADQLRARISRIAGERLPRRQAFFARRPGQDRTAEKTPQGRQRRRVAQL